MTFRFKDHLYYIPEAGNLIPKAIPYVSLRFIPKKVGEKSAKIEYVDMQLNADMAFACRSFLDQQISLGYDANDFCVSGNISNTQFTYDADGFMIHKKVRTKVIDVACGFVDGQLVHRQELALLFTEQLVLSFTNDGRVNRHTRTSITEVGYREDFLNAATAALEDGIDLKWGTAFVWKAQKPNSKMLMETLDEIQKFGTKVKFVL